MSSKRTILLLISIAIVALGGCAPSDGISYPTFGIPWLNEIHAVMEYAIHDVAWSPDGEQIAMVGFRKGSIDQDVLLYDIRTQEYLVILGREHGFTAGFVSWSPDGDFLVVSGNASTEPGSGLWLVPVNGDSPSYITHGLSSSLSPDGDWLAVLTPTIDSLEIKLWDMNTGSERILAVMTDEGDSMATNIEWSPDGEFIAFTAVTLDQDEPILGESLFFLDPEHPEPRRVFPDLQLEIWGFGWFPDGEWMAMTVLVEEYIHYQIQLASIEDECFIPLWPDSRTAWRDVDVSPDGTQLIASNGDAYIIDMEAMAAEGLIEFPLRCP